MSQQVNQTTKGVFSYQDEVDYINNSLVINTWETVDANLSDGDPAELLYIQVEQTNDGAAVEDIELEITINGVAHTWSLGGIASGVVQFCGIDMDGVTTFQATTPRQPQALDDDQSAPLKAATIGLIRERQTSVVDGVSASIEVNIKWNKRVAI